MSTISSPATVRDLPSGSWSVEAGTCPAELALAAIDTGHRHLDLDLAKPKLFDLQRFPLLTFDLATGGQATQGQQLNGPCRRTVAAFRSNSAPKCATWLGTTFLSVWSALSTEPPSASWRRVL